MVHTRLRAGRPGALVPLLGAAMGWACASAPPSSSSDPARAVAASSSSVPVVTSSSVAPSADVPTESPAERRKRIRAAKQQGCRELAQAVEARGQDILLNVHNGATLIAMAGELDESTDRVDRVKITTEELEQLRALQRDYAKTARAMSRALFATADAAGFEQRQGPLAEFRELEPQLRAKLGEMSDYCSAPVE
jgi:hypothetical protein